MNELFIIVRFVFHTLTYGKFVVDPDQKQTFKTVSQITALLIVIGVVTFLIYRASVFTKNIRCDVVIRTYRMDPIILLRVIYHSGRECGTLRDCLQCHACIDLVRPRVA